jgi:hypothetical protein
MAQNPRAEPWLHFVPHSREASCGWSRLQSEPEQHEGGEMYAPGRRVEAEVVGGYPGVAWCYGSRGRADGQTRLQMIATRQVN